MEGIIIRPATSLDLETLYKFEQGIIEAERPFDATLKEGHIHYYDLRQMIDAAETHLVVAEVAKEIVSCGYARIEASKPYLQHDKHAYLGFMYVSPLHRGKGINGLIIEALKAWARSKNIHELRLEVYVENHSAIRAYQKLGFSKHMIEMRLPV